MNFRIYDPSKDLEAVQRIWREIGCLQDGQEEAVGVFLSAANTTVADVGGEPECLVATVPGTIRYLDEDLPFGIVGSVTTSRVARKQRLASRLTAHAVADLAAGGALVAGLGMFEQGYYNKLGFGNGSYENWISFDPADLLVDAVPRVPRRLGSADWEAVHACRLSRRRGHGSCNSMLPQRTQAEMMGGKNDFGLGYFDGPNGELTHFFWVGPENVSHGPYNIRAICWQQGDQFLELLALIKSLGDQVHLVSMQEPAGIQLQDLLRQPLKRRHVSGQSKFESSSRSDAYWQVRILDLVGCMQRTHLPCGDIRFNLRLEDPIESLLDADAPWHGTGGEYVVALGSKSIAYPGSDGSLPALTASVGAFTRMWFGVCPASGLAITDGLSGPPQLLRDLDRGLLLPRPHLGWDI